jgi:hypothetical protein
MTQLSLSNAGHAAMRKQTWREAFLFEIGTDYLPENGRGASSWRTAAERLALRCGIWTCPMPGRRLATAAGRYGTAMSILLTG